MINRGLIRKVYFGAIAAPDAGDTITDESFDEDEDELDELDAFARLTTWTLQKWVLE